MRVTSSPEPESAPRWSPDGRYLAFLSSRPGKAKGNQIWMLDRTGGEAQQFTDFKGRLTAYDWSPDSKKLLLVMAERDPGDPEEGAPIVSPILYAGPSQSTSVSRPSLLSVRPME